MLVKANKKEEETKVWSNIHNSMSSSTLLIVPANFGGICVFIIISISNPVIY